MKNNCLPETLHLIIWKRIKHFIISACLFIRYKNCNRGNYFFLLDTPLHDNIGDQAIVCAEVEFLKRSFPTKKILEIPSEYLIKYIGVWKKIIGRNTILIHGGGFIGTLWEKEDYYFRIILKTFRNNRIIVFPQSIFFEASSSEKIKSLSELIKNCKDITICERELFSYDLACKYFSNSNNILIPDIVLSTKQLRTIMKKHRKDIIMVCMRNDPEKTSRLTQADLASFIINNNLNDYEVVSDDMIANQVVNRKNRKQIVLKKIKEFSRVKLVITDRLHGMIFSILSGTPVIIFDNISHKVLGEYNLINSDINARMVDSLDEVLNVDEMLNNIVKYDNSILKPYYDTLLSVFEGL